MAYYFTVVISETRPAKPLFGWYWIDPSGTQVWFRGTANWIPVTGDIPIINHPNGTFWRRHYVQETPPSGEIGVKWTKESARQSWMYLTGWCPITI